MGAHMKNPLSLIYIHGFISSPQSAKAQLLLIAMRSLGRENEYRTPQLPLDPEQAIKKLEALIKSNQQQQNTANIGLVGSSLGGYYALWLANKYNLKAVLVNPSVRPYDSLKAHLGEVENIYSGEKYTFNKSHINVLKSYEVKTPEKLENFYLMVQTGDEVLDYRQALEKFSLSERIESGKGVEGIKYEVQKGGSHGFDKFENMIPGILQFLGVNKK